MQPLKNKIKKFSKGDFSIPKPDIVFEEARLIISVGEGELYRGSFKLRNRRDGDIRGLVYPSSFRVHLSESGFDGNPVEVTFTYDGTGLKPGAVEQGKFTIVCNGGEYELAFTAIVEKPYLMTSYGKVQSLRDFKQLAIQDFTEAQRLFRSRDFYEILKYEEPRILNLYTNMRKWSLGEQALEEFLVGIKLKECLFLTLSSAEKYAEGVNEATKETITLYKNTWGFMPVKAYAEGEFLVCNKREFTTDDFIGSSYNYEYLIIPSRLHAGNNYGRIIFETPYEKVVYPIHISLKGERDEKHRELEFLFAQVLKKFLACESGREEWVVWAKQANAALDILKNNAKNGTIYQLVQAHVKFIVGKTEEAEWILENYNYNRMTNYKTPIASAYYLYLTTKTNPAISHVNRVVEEIQKLYMRNPQSWEILCMLGEIDPEYKNFDKRLHVYERQFYNGANHILFYMQAFKCYRDEHTTLKKLETFEIQVLNFAAKYKLISREHALYIANLASQQKLFHKQLYKIMETLFRLYDEGMILTAICTLLIKGNKSGTQYFKWYKKAVDQELKIVQLYEYYMMSIDESKVRGPFPQTIYLYFMHGNVLDYSKAALLYANIVTYQENNTELYTQYREKIVRFTWEQLEKRHINESLCILYKRYCIEDEMTAKRVQALYDICHAYEVKTRKPDMKFVMVIEQDGEITQRVACINSRAQVCLYAKEPRIIWESNNGRYYTDSIPYETRRLFYEPRLIEMCRRFLGINQQGREDLEDTQLSFDNVRLLGLEAFDKHEVFKLCSKQIREENYEEDELLLYLCFQLFEAGQYDTVTLTYLTNYFCGATSDMKRLWHTAREYDVSAHKLSERIITQMVFAENMFQEEEIFAYYYVGGAYFRLKKAYLAYVSKEYVVSKRVLEPSIFAIITNEYNEQEDMADICKVAMLRYYSDHHYDAAQEPMLQNFLKELCEKQLVFPFYLKFNPSWLREVQLYDKYMIEYCAKSDGKVEVEYQITQGERDSLEYKTEILLPMYENLYVRIFILYKDEYLRYSFKETLPDSRIIAAPKRIYHIEAEIPPVGIYGKLNEMTDLELSARRTAEAEFWKEIQIAQEIFSSY
ncbi:MAG: DUF5717 family protein [Lachnospiraceae bacterium]